MNIKNRNFKIHTTNNFSKDARKPNHFGIGSQKASIFHKFVAGFYLFCGFCLENKNDY